MTRREILAVAKPILFNTEMVRAILDGRKTATRRIIKPQPWCECPRDCGCTLWDNGKVDAACPRHCISMPNALYQSGDILYVRETWAFDTGATVDDVGTGYFIYKADEQCNALHHWRPSIHMPKEAARLFLRVTKVQVERLQDITEDGLHSEGVELGAFKVSHAFAEGILHGIWDSTIKPADLPIYGWEANPWVWVIEFERVIPEVR